MFAADIEPDEWARTVERETWLLLAQMVGCGAVLGRNARTTWEELTSRHPEWRLEPEERDEFPFWMGDGRELSRFVATPRRRRDLVEWLTQHADRESWHEDDWRLRCENDFAVTACALCALARNGAWPRVRWREALQAWSEDKLVERSWRYMARTLADVPDDELAKPCPWRWSLAEQGGENARAPRGSLFRSLPDAFWRSSMKTIEREMSTIR